MLYKVSYPSIYVYIYPKLRSCRTEPYILVVANHIMLCNVHIFLHIYQLSIKLKSNACSISSIIITESNCLFAKMYANAIKCHEFNYLFIKFSFYMSSHIKKNHFVINVAIIVNFFSICSLVFILIIAFFHISLFIAILYGYIQQTQHYTLYNVTSCT